MKCENWPTFARWRPVFSADGVRISPFGLLLNQLDLRRIDMRLSAYSFRNYYFY